jgi:hypothetical protein
MLRLSKKPNRVTIDIDFGGGFFFDKTYFPTLAAERQDPDFLIGPRNEK